MDWEQAAGIAAGALGFSIGIFGFLMRAGNARYAPKVETEARLSALETDSRQKNETLKRLEQSIERIHVTTTETNLTVARLAGAQAERDRRD